MTTPDIAPTTDPSAGATRDELPPTYDPKGVEAEMYRRWEEAGVFRARAERSTRAGGDREPFVIVMPPPNVTAVLHMGHGLDNTVQDVLIRWRRMAGDEALWVPGTDHAGIATQNVIEKQLAGEGKTRYDLGREAFVERTTAFVAETGGRIIDQLRAIGASADWSRTGYTLSPELSRAVREAFVRLYEAGLVYKGHRVIHWCPRCLTSLSDEEAEPNQEGGKLHHVRYAVEGDPSRTVTVATTRPETMLADVAVAVNPADGRYADLVGRRVILPLLDRPIPVIADEYADPEFGTGAVKITPAHDANDFEVGRRHGLAMPVVIDAHGRMAEVSDAAGRVPAWLAGRDRFEARALVVARLQESGALEKVEAREHAVRHCYRCDTVVEPRLSDQWFVKMAPLAEPALAARRDGRVRILPERWEAVYDHWLENIRDWNISRQLWWGHRIPVWYCEAHPEPIVSRTDVAACPRCGGAVRQDEDVLDTWFSSWLWPISTLGWPDEEAKDLKTFYPTDVLVSGPDILFFWIARMIFSGFFFKGEAPYHTVYLHGIARDTQHRKMSKSLGNGIDPLEVVERFGADALRYTVVAGMGMGVDIIFDPTDLEKSFAVGRNFATKLWNIGRFLLRSVGDERVRPLAEIDRARLTRADVWILDRLNAAIARCDAALGPARPAGGRAWGAAERTQGLRLNEYAEAARQFVWNELADWYVEAVKGRVTSVGHDRDVARAVLVHCFDQALRLLHPIVPFITETLWQRLPSSPEGAFLAASAWPTPVPEHDGFAEASLQFDVVASTVMAIRQLRSEYNLPPGQTVDVVVVPAEAALGAAVRQLHEHEAGLVGRLTRGHVRVESEPPGGASATAIIAGGTQVVLPLAGLIDVEKERKRLEGELANLDKQLAALRGRLANENFVARAKPEVVEMERAKALEWSARRDGLAAKVRALGGA